jgi:hypothetical protein
LPYRISRRCRTNFGWGQDEDDLQGAYVYAHETFTIRSCEAGNINIGVTFFVCTRVIFWFSFGSKTPFYNGKISCAVTKQPAGRHPAHSSPLCLWNVCRLSRYAACDYQGTIMIIEVCRLSRYAACDYQGTIMTIKVCRLSRYAACAQSMRLHDAAQASMSESNVRLSA